MAPIPTLGDVHFATVLLGLYDFPLVFQVSLRGDGKANKILDVFDVCLGVFENQEPFLDGPFLVGNFPGRFLTTNCFAKGSSEKTHNVFC